MKARQLAIYISTVLKKYSKRLLRKSHGQKKNEIYKGIFLQLLHSPIALFVLASVLVLIFSIISVSIVVQLPVRGVKAHVDIDNRGGEIVKSWLLPPGDLLEPKIYFFREKAGQYTEEDAKRLGLPPVLSDIELLKKNNDKTMEELFRTIK